MNIKNIIPTLFVLILSLGTIQAQTVIYGNIGVENANVSVKKSTYGTSTDTKGSYTIRLHNRNQQIDLHYSCIGYHDTIVRLTRQQLQHDSIQISFKMRKRGYNLQEVGVIATKPSRLEDERYFIMDFEMYDGTLCLLEASHNRKLFRIILTDEHLYGLDTILIPTDIKPEKLQRDCLGNCQLIAIDSVYEIDLLNKPHHFISALKSYYFRVMNGCLFATDQHIYVKEKSMQGYLTSFYRIDRSSKSIQPLFVSDMTENIGNYRDEMCFHAAHPNPVPSGVWSRFIKTHWFRTSNAELALADDTLIYFDQSLGIIYRYNLSISKIDSCVINYPFMKGWKNLLFQDPARNHFYTIIQDHLFEIDPKTGLVSSKTGLKTELFNKIVIYNGCLFVLRRLTDSSGKLRSYVERRDI